MPLMLLMLRAHNNNDASREGKSDRSNGEEDVTRSENKKRIDEITRSYLKKAHQAAHLTALVSRW
jgi:hypothetical protein